MSSQNNSQSLTTEITEELLFRFCSVSSVASVVKFVRAHFESSFLITFPPFITNFTR